MLDKLQTFIKDAYRYADLSRLRDAGTERNPKVSGPNT
jgi:hypothetical protein